MDDKKRAEKERKKAEAKASKEVLGRLSFRDKLTLQTGFGGLVSNGVSIGYGRNSDQWYAIAGCTATIRYGAIETHQSAGRIAAGGAVAGWKGAAVGSVMGQTSQNIWVDLTWPGGFTLSALGVGEANAAKFVNLVNEMSGQF